MGKRYREQESKEEMLGALEVGSTSFNDMLVANRIALLCSSYEQKKNGRVEVNARGQDVGGDAIWGKFIQHKGYNNASLISLSKDTNRLTEELYSFLVNDYAQLSKSCSDRYQNLDLEGKTWLMKVARLAVKHHLMKNKLDGYIKSFANENDDEDYFCNDFALYLYALLNKGIKVLLNHIIRDIQHLVKEPERADYYIERIMSIHYEQLRQAPFPQRDNILRLVKPDTENDEVAM